MVSQHLPFVMGEVFNRPHLISEAHAAMIAAVLSGKMNITSLSGEFGSMDDRGMRSEEHTSELQSLMRISYAVFRLKKKNYNTHTKHTQLYHTISTFYRHVDRNK